MKNITKVIIALLSCLLMGILGIMIFAYRNLQNINREIPTSSQNPASQTETILIEETTTETIIETTERPAVIPEIKDITFVFTGDILLSDYVLNSYEKTGISGVLSDKLIQEMKNANVTMVNQEFPFSTRGTAAADKQYTFRVDPQRVTILKEMGIDIVTIANNHTLDFGEEALLDTCETLDDAKIKYVGAGENLDRAKRLETIEINDKVIGFLAASRVIPVTTWNAASNKPGMLTTYDPTILLQEIKKAKEICDTVVVYLHWGIERDNMPQNYQRSLAKQYIDAGADMVIGSHPHVLQGIEFYDGKPIVYSLGNFVFGSSIPVTMLLKVILQEDGSIRMYSVPATSLNGYTSDTTKEKEKEIYTYLESISFGVKISDDGEIIQND